MASAQRAERVALVTGANKGIGFETTRHLGDPRPTVLIGARDPQRGQGAVERLRAKGLDGRGLEAQMPRFNVFRLDTVNEYLWRAGVPIELTPKAFAVLRYLVEHPGRLVTQRELLDALWPDVYVQPEIVKTYIRDIRKILGDRPKAPRFIETRPRRGYRFVAAVTDESGTLPAPSASSRHGQTVGASNTRDPAGALLRIAEAPVGMRGTPNLASTVSSITDR